MDPTEWGEGGSSPGKASSQSPPRSSSGDVPSPYRKPRFGRQTRREAMMTRRRFSKGAAVGGGEESPPSCHEEDEKKDDDDDRSLRAPGDPGDHPDPPSVDRCVKKKHSKPTNEKNRRRKPFPPSFDSPEDEEKRSSVGNTTVTTATASSVTQPATYHGYSALPDDEPASPRQLHLPDDDDGSHQQETAASPASSGPLHLPPHRSEMEGRREDGGDDDGGVRFYRVSYRGVVALLSAPDESAPRSGSYLSYGEVFSSRFEENLEGDSAEVGSSPASPHRMIVDEDEALPGTSDSLPPPSVASHHTGGDSISSLDTLRTASTALAPTTEPSRRRSKRSGRRNSKIIRVDRILTGGYAMDAPEGSRTVTESEADTPRRSNTDYIPVTGTAPLESGYAELTDGCPGRTDTPSPSEGGYGYLFSCRRDESIVEPVDTAPRAEHGRFSYRIMSTTPLPILTGPSFDAPKTKAMVLPGTVHEVSLRVSVDPDGEGSWFLRLAHRRGWIADRKLSTRRGGPRAMHSVPVVRELGSSNGGPGTADTGSADDGSVSALSSVTASSVTSGGSIARRRHRPPRRRRGDAAAGKEGPADKTFPRQVGAKPLVTGAQQLQQQGKNGRFAAVDGVPTPSSNVSVLSDESSLEHHHNQLTGGFAFRHHNGAVALSAAATMPQSPDVSHATARSAGSAASSTNHSGSRFYLMRVTAPRGLKILDAPQFQVNNLIHGKHGTANNVSSSHMVTQIESSNSGPNKTHQSIFQTMSGRLTTTGPSKSGNPAVFDSTSKTRILPRGALFEASKRMESSGAYSQGAGLIRLSDKSGWAIVPRQDELDRQYRNYHGGMAGIKEGEATRAYEEVGNALLDYGNFESVRPSGVWIRVTARSGLTVSCPPPDVPLYDNDTVSPSSKGSSAVSGGGALGRDDSDVASSVGSSFLDAVMFRTPKKSKDNEGLPEAQARQPPKGGGGDKFAPFSVSYGTCVEVERWSDAPCDPHGTTTMGPEYVRLRGGQGWLPLKLSGKPAAVQVPRPDFRLGSFWFRVQSSRGIKVRLGPSRRAPSIKSEDGVYFRFECGEFLRASEIVTVFSSDGEPRECFAKLYRNCHVRLHRGHEEYRQLASLTAAAEWVQVHGHEELYLEECATVPKIERHRQGWRYSVVAESGVAIRRGPSFAAEKTGLVLMAGETVVINERVSPAGEGLTWLRMKDGHGWVHDADDRGEKIMAAHSLRHRSAGVGGGGAAAGTSRPQKPPAPQEEIAYNTIIARLFHNDAVVPGGGIVPSSSYRSTRDRNAPMR